MFIQGDPIEEQPADEYDGRAPELRSDAQNYGRHLDTEHGKLMHRMQMKFESGFRRKPMSKEISFM